MGASELGLAPPIEACLFDLDGVLTETAKVHAKAWKEAFDAFLAERARKDGESFRGSDLEEDYDRYVDGKPRLDGVRSFLAARGIELPQGSPGDPPQAPTVQGLGNRKNQVLLRLLEEDGVEAYPGSRRYLEAVRKAGLKTAVVSSSANCKAALRAARLEGFFRVVVDGVVAEDLHLEGKPAPATFLAAARALGVKAASAAVFEDALAGVEAGRAGGFGFVVGVDRAGQEEELLRHGADRVVKDLEELLPS